MTKLNYNRDDVTNRLQDTDGRQIQNEQKSEIPIGLIQNPFPLV